MDIRRRVEASQVEELHFSDRKCGSEHENNAIDVKKLGIVPGVKSSIPRYRRVSSGRNGLLVRP